MCPSRTEEIYSCARQRDTRALKNEATFPILSESPLHYFDTPKKQTKKNKVAKHHTPKTSPNPCVFSSFSLLFTAPSALWVHILKAASPRITRKSKIYLIYKFRSLQNSSFLKAKGAKEKGPPDMSKPHRNSASTQDVAGGHLHPGMAVSPLAGPWFTETEILNPTDSPGASWLLLDHFQTQRNTCK